MTESGNVFRLHQQTNCARCQMADECLGAGIGPLEAPAGLDLPVTPRLHHRGDHLFRTGDNFKALHVVRSGAIKTLVVSEEGEEQIVEFHAPGDILGMDAIASGVHVCDAVSLDTTSVCIIPFERLSRLCARVPAFNRQFLNRMSRQIHRGENMLLMLGRKNADQRMAAFLVEQSTRRAQCGYSATDFTVSMSRTDIGSYLGLAVETVSRVLTRFQTNDWIHVKRNSFRILDMPALQALCEEPVPPAAPARVGAR